MIFIFLRLQEVGRKVEFVTTLLGQGGFSGEYRFVEN